MCDNARERIKIQIKEKEKTQEPVLLALLQRADVFLSQTYTPKPDTTQRNSKECCTPAGSHVHAGKAMTFSENNSRCRQYLQPKNRPIK